MLITQTYAQESGVAAPEQGFSIASFVPLLLIFAVFYFLIIRPQNKKMKEHQKMVSELKTGNKVITNSGIIGTIKAIDKKEDILEVEIADDVNIKILRNFVSELVKKEEKTKKNKK